MENLVSVGLDLGTKRFIFREIFYHPESNVVDHNRMPELLLKENDFSIMKQSLIEKFGGVAPFTFADKQYLDSSRQTILSDSVRD